MTASTINAASAVDQSIWTGRLRKGARYAAWLIGAIAVTGVEAGFASVSSSTSVALLAVAVALHMLSGQDTPWARQTAWAASLVVAGLVSLGLIHHLELGLSGWPLDDASSGIAWSEASGLLLLAIALVLAGRDDERARAWTHALAAVIAGIALVALVGTSFRVAWVYSPAAPVGIRPAVAIALLAASFSLVALSPRRRLVEVLEGDSPGAVVARRLLPAAIVLPLLIGWAQAFGRRTGWIDVAAGEGMLTAITMFACVLLVIWTSRKLDDLHAHRSRAELRADTQREWLDVTLISIGDAVITADREGRIGLLNPATESLLGVKASEAVGRPIGDLVRLVDERSGLALPCPFQQAVAESRSVAVPGEPAVSAVQGKLRAVDANATPIFDAGGQLVGGVLVLRDATARRAGERAMRAAYADLDRRVGERTEALGRAKAALRKSTALLQTFATSTPEPIIATDLEGRLMLVNPAALRLMGMSEEQVIGRTKRELWGESEEIRRIEEIDRRVLSAGSSEVVEETLQAPEGSRTFLMTKSPLRDDEGQTIGVVGVGADITERKRVQRELEQLLMAEHRLRAEAERASRAKDEFLAIVSHELRSPLNALKGWSHILSGTTPPAPVLVTRAAQAIRRNVDHQGRLIDDLLDTSRIISGKLVLERRPVNLVEVVHAALDLSRVNALAKRIELKFHTDQPVVTTDGDQGRLQQVVINLLSNAIKFTPEGGWVEITLKCEDDHIALDVADNGIGIEADFLPYVFDRFSQANSSTTRRFQGLGIGLALARHLVEMHGGAIRAMSGGAGCGARFTVELPLAQEIPATPRLAVKDPMQAQRLEGVSVLSVDDDPDAREVIGLMLTNAGARVQVFPSGDALLAKLRQESPPEAPVVLLLDIAMPDVDGFGVLHAVREQLGSAQFIPAIAVTALTHLDRRQLAMEGFQDCVGKPIDADRLVAAISTLVGRQQDEAVSAGASRSE